MQRKVGLIFVVLVLGASTSVFAQVFQGYSLGVGAKLFDSSYRDTASSTTTSITSAGFNSVLYWGSNLGFYSDVSIGVPLVGRNSASGSVSLSQYNQFRVAIDEIGPLGFVFTPTHRLFVAIGGPAHVSAVLLSSSSYGISPIGGWEGVGLGVSGEAMYRLGRHFGLYAVGAFGYDVFGISTSFSGSYGGGYDWSAGVGIDSIRL